MGIFFRAEPVLKARMADASRHPIPADENTVELLAAEAVENVAKQVRQTFDGRRALFAALLLIGVLVAGLYAGLHPQLEKLYEALIHAFEVLLGAVAGLITGEAAANR